MNVGDRVYFIESGRRICPAVIKWKPERMYLLEYGHGENSGAICLPASRVYESIEEAEKHITTAPEYAVSNPSPTSQTTYAMRQAYDLCGKP